MALNLDGDASDEHEPNTYDFPIGMNLLKK